MANPEDVFIGSRLKLAREAKGYTQDDVTRLLELGDSTLSGYETGRTKISIKNAYRLVKLYGVPPASIHPGYVLPADLGEADVIRDQIILRLINIEPAYLALLDDVVAAFENYDPAKGIGNFHALIDEIKPKGQAQE